MKTAGRRVAEFAAADYAVTWAVPLIWEQRLPTATAHVAALVVVSCYSALLDLRRHHPASTNAIPNEAR